MYCTCTVLAPLDYCLIDRRRAPQKAPGPPCIEGVQSVQYRTKFWESLFIGREGRHRRFRCVPKIEAHTALKEVTGRRQQYYHRLKSHCWTKRDQFIVSIAKQICIEMAAATAASSDHTGTNGLQNNAQAHGMQSSEPLPEPAKSATTLQEELTAATTYLQKQISDPNLVETVAKASESGDKLAATSALVDAFLKALDAPADPDGPASLEGCMQEVLVWLRKQCAMDSAIVDKLVEGLCRGLSSPTLRLRCMAFLYNSVDEQNHKKRFSLLLSTISLASSLNMVQSIVNTILPKVETFIRVWNLELPEKRQAYNACYHALKTANIPDRAFTVNVKLLTLYNGAAEADFATIQAETVDVIVQAVRLPKLYRFDTLLELDAVKRFKTLATGDYKLLYELINIFVRDDLAVFREFRAKHEEVLVKYSIDVEVAEEKMRLLTFASLGIESQDLTYEMIASALHISEEDVEHWVIRAISSGLVDAKINQLKSSVAIYRSTQRMFTREEWQPLSERINIWKENIGDLLTALQETRSASTSAVAEAFSG